MVRVRGFTFGTGSVELEDEPCLFGAFTAANSFIRRSWLLFSVALGKSLVVGVSKGVMGVCTFAESLSKILASETVDSTLETDEPVGRRGVLVRSSLAPPTSVVGIAAV